MITDVTRAYVPTVKWGFSASQNIPFANMLGQTIRLVVDPRLVHRKVWAWIWSTGSFSIDYDLVASLNGSEVYRQKLAQYPGWYSGLNGVSTLIGSVNEQVFTTLNGTTLYGMSPWRLNITCDHFLLQMNSLTGAAANFDYGLYCQSQAGI